MTRRLAGPALLALLFATGCAQVPGLMAGGQAASGFDAVVVHGGSARKRSDFDDQWWPLRATPHFQHLWR